MSQVGSRLSKQSENTKDCESCCHVNNVEPSVLFTGFRILKQTLPNPSKVSKASLMEKGIVLYSGLTEITLCKRLMAYLLVQGRIFVLSSVVS